jgi:hypothetical protein
MPINRSDPSDPLPESAMGGASDSGAHGRYPTPHPEGLPRPDDPIGDAAIERRHHHADSAYRGPERRQARLPGLFTPP